MPDVMPAESTQALLLLSAKASSAQGYRSVGAHGCNHNMKVVLLLSAKASSAQGYGSVGAHGCNHNMKVVLPATVSLETSQFSTKTWKAARISKGWRI